MTIQVSYQLEIKLRVGFFFYPCDITEFFRSIVWVTAENFPVNIRVFKGKLFQLFPIRPDVGTILFGHPEMLFEDLASEVENRAFSHRAIWVFNDHGQLRVSRPEEAPVIDVG